MNTKKSLVGVFAVLLGLGLASFKEDDRNFQIAKNLDLFNAIFKELDMFYVDTVKPEEMIQNGVEGMLALTFVNKDDYDKVREDDRVSVTGLRELAPGSKLTVILRHADGTQETIEAEHTYNETQIAWFKAGSALNYAKEKHAS